MEINFRKFYGYFYELLDRFGIYVRIVVTIIYPRFSNMSYRITLITGFVRTCAAHRMSCVDQNLLTFPDHVFDPSLDLCIALCILLIVVCSFCVLFLVMALSVCFRLLCLNILSVSLVSLSDILLIKSYDQFLLEMSKDLTFVLGY